jgi:hypothetical protein
MRISAEKLFAAAHGPPLLTWLAELIHECELVGLKGASRRDIELNTFPSLSAATATSNDSAPTSFAGRIRPRPSHPKSRSR